MNDFASKMQFEEAQKVKEKIDVLENYQSRSTIINPKITNIFDFDFDDFELIDYNPHPHIKGKVAV